MKYKILIINTLLFLNVFPAFAQNLLSPEELSLKSAFRNIPSEKQALEVYKITIENIGEIPNNINQFKNLQHFHTFGNDWDYSLKNIPENFYKLRNLTKIAFHNNEISQISPQINQLANLLEISILNTKIKELPLEIIQLNKLQKLSIDQNIQSIPPMLSLQELDYWAYNVEKIFIKNLEKLNNLQTLRLLGTGNFDLIPIIQTIQKMPQLKTLEIFQTIDNELIKEIGKIKNLEILKLKNYEGKPELLSFLVNLREISIENFSPDFPKIQYLQNIARLPFLTHFETEFHEKDIPFYSKFKNLSLNFGEERLQEKDIHTMTHLSNLKKLKLSEIPNQFEKFQHLQELDLQGFKYKLYGYFFDKLAKLTRLEKISLNNDVLTVFPPEIEKLQQLKEIWVYNFQHGVLEAISQAEKEKLQKTLPKCKLIFVE